MAVETESERLAFFDPEEFGVEAVARPGQAGEFSLPGIFDSAHTSSDAGAGVEVSSYAPTFTCRTSDAGGLGQRDFIEIEGARFEVADVEPDGTGVTILVLWKA